MAIKRIPNKDNVYNKSDDNNNDDIDNDIDQNILESWRNEEDVIILKQFCNIILENFNNSTIIADVKLHWRVTTTAIIYFQRFYLNNNLLSHDPRLIMITCIFLAGKVEECRLTLRKLLELFNVGTEEDILACELKLIEALEFDLKIHHPHSLMKTIIADIPLALDEMKKKNIINNDIFDNINQSEVRRQWSTNAEEILNKLYLSYALLCFNPMTLVIYALKTSETIQIIDKYIEYRHESVSSSLLLQVEQVKTFLNEANDNVDQKTIKKYMKKLEKSSVWNDK
jgi:cyclin H